MCINKSMSLALSTCVLFISLMHSVNGAEVRNTTSMDIGTAEAKS